MKKILTTPEELMTNKRVFYVGNHYISLPEIDPEEVSVKSLNIVSMRNKGLIQLTGKENLLKIEFFRNGEELKPINIECDREYYYIPVFKIFFDKDQWAKVRIYPDIREKGLVYEFESSDTIYVKLVCDIYNLSFLRFNSHDVDFKKEIKTDRWLGNPAVTISSYNVNFGMAFGGEENFEFEYLEDGKINLILKCEEKNAFYITLNFDTDGASTTLVHLRRKGYQNIYQELKDWLNNRCIRYSSDLELEKIINLNLFFNYFFAIGKDMESDRYIALTSRSPRYYVSGAFWERDSFLWSFPAIKIVDEGLYTELVREIILLHYKNAGDHAHYIDGTVLYPGFELDEAASYFILINDLKEVDGEILRALEYVLRRIEGEYDKETGLYKTFLLPSDDPAEYPFVTIDNVILWHGLRNLANLYKKLGMANKASIIQERIDGIHKGIYKYLVKEIDSKKVFVWSGDSLGNYRLYNDPPGNLGLLYYYGFVGYNDEIFKNTIEYYYSSKYKYYFTNSKFKELACDHHPNTPSGLGLCGSILNPLKHKEAVTWVKEANMDYGLLAESFDSITGEAKTGVGFATGSGYLAYALYYTLKKGGLY